MSTTNTTIETGTRVRVREGLRDPGAAGLAGQEGTVVLVVGRVKEDDPYTGLPDVEVGDLAIFVELDDGGLEALLDREVEVIEEGA